jgi:outer membrane protein, heavy metal efflux system
MRSIRDRILAAGLLIVLLLWNISAVAQQPDSNFSLSSEASVVSDISAGGAKSPTLPTISLHSLVEQALEHNPEIKSMQRSFDMMRARIPQAKALPDPMLEMGYAGNIVPLPPFDIQKGDPSSARMFAFTQELPFPGKLALKGKIASMEADSEWWSYEQVRLNIIAELKDAYFELWYLTKAIDTVNRNKTLLEKFAKIAEARYSVGKGIQQDVLKAQVEISKLIDQSTVLEQRRYTTEARLNSLLYRELESSIGRPEELKPLEFFFTLSELNETALANSPTLKMQKRKIDREQYGLQLAKKDFYPDMSIGFTYQNRPGMPEMYGLTLGLKIPLYFWQKQRPAVEEATAGLSMERKRLDNTTSLLFYKIKDKYLAATTARRLIKLYGTVIIPQSTLSLESAIVGYEVGKVDFLTLLDSLTTLLSYELNYFEQLGNLEKAVAAIEPLVGSNLRP